MSQIEIPDWVVEAALKAWFSGEDYEGADLSAFTEDMRAALRAALEGWLVPRGYLITWHSSGEQVVSARPAHQDDGKTDTLYLFRKEPAA